MFTSETPEVVWTTRNWAVLPLLLPPPPSATKTPSKDAKTPTRPPTELLRCKQLVYQKTGNSGNWMRRERSIDALGADVMFCAWGLFLLPSKRADYRRPCLHFHGSTVQNIWPILPLFDGIHRGCGKRRVSGNEVHRF